MKNKELIETRLNNALQKISELFIDQIHSKISKVDPLPTNSFSEISKVIFSFVKFLRNF